MRSILMAGSISLLLFITACSPGNVTHPADDARPATDDHPLLERADRSRMFGDQNAPVVIEEYVDFACPDCRVFHVEGAPAVNDRFVETGEAYFIFRAFPIPRLMRGYHAFEAALCAGAVADQAGFVAMRDLLFQHQSVWRFRLDTRPLFTEYARTAELPAEEFADCLDRNAMAPLILADYQMAGRLEVQGTPTFVVNRRGTPFTGEERFYGNEPLRRFEEAIERVMARTRQ
jgi:protein-disulfide isomerase